MWCRTILTAVAISYVICVLLLNGLQKEDLDENTLEKLRRHNVNIYDMNNESLRQACLLNSYLETGNATRKKYETTEDVNEALGISSTAKSEDQDIKVGDYLKLELRVPESYENKTIPNSTLDFNNTASFLQQLQALNENLKTNTKIDHIYNSGNVKKIEENSGLQIEYMQNRPPMENMVNFWTKLTHNTKKVVTKVATTQPPCADESEPKNATTVNTQTSNNNGYVHSREMEYISRIIAEYLATQTAPTTTQRITTEPYINSISRQIGELLQKTSKKELTSNDESSQAKNFKRISAYPRKINYDYMTDDVKSLPYQMLFENNQQLENIERTLHPRKFFYVDSKEENKSKPSTKRASVKSQQISKIQDQPYYSNIIKVKTKSVEPKLKIKSSPIRYFPNFSNKSSSKHFYDREEQQNDSGHFNQRNNETDDQTKSNTKITANTQDFSMNSYQVKDETKELIPIHEEVINERVKVLPARKKKIDEEKNYELKVIPKSETTFTKNIKDTNIDSTVKPLSLNQTEQVQNVMDNFNQHQNNVMPEDIKTSKPKQDFVFENNNFDGVLPSIKAAKLNKKSGIENKQTKSISAEIIHNFDMDHNHFNNLGIDPKTAQKYEAENDRYGGMLPSIKMAKINQNEKNISNPIKHSAELNNSELVKKFGMFNEQYKAMQAEASKSDHNKISIINNEQPESAPHVTTNDIRTLNSGVNKNQFNIMPAVIKNTDRIQLSRNQLKILPANLSISEQNQKFEINNEQVQPIPVDLKDLKPFQNFGMNMNEPQVIPANVIKEIAEKVKQIVLRDMGKERTTHSPLPRTTVHVNVSTMTSSTTETSIPTNATITTKTTTTEKPSTPHKETKESNQVMQKLMEMFNEFKIIKDSTKMTTAAPLVTKTRYTQSSRPKLHTLPPALAGFNPYVIKTPPIFKSALGSIKPIEISPYGPSMVPVPISSGANLPKDKVSQYVPQLIIHPKNDFGSGAITLQTNSDEIAPLAIQISRPMKLMNQHIIVTTRSPIDDQRMQQERASKKRLEEKFRDPRYHKEKYHLDSEFLKKIRLETDRREYVYNERLNKKAEKPKYTHEFSENFRGLSHVENVARPSYRENISNKNKQRHGGGYPRDYTYTGGLSNLGGMRYPRINYARGYKREQAGTSGKRPYRHSEQDHLEPQYLATKFHEKLERIETWPRNTWFRTVTTENCCDDIAARQQVPLTKMKQRTRFDDTHFKNFLKSQQKVTDMLERILASNTKPNGPHSVELP